MIVALLLAAASLPSDCSYDRTAMLALPQQRFDQDMTGGWRELANRGCDVEAADLIRDWRQAHAVPADRAGILVWHEGQLRANAGQDAAAIALFDRARKTADEDAGFGWNLYVDGSIAFLRHDRHAFDEAYAKLAALPKPADFEPVGPDGKPMTVAWPMNLNVLDGFRRCWNQPYKIAYGPTCSKPMFRYTTPDK